MLFKPFALEIYERFLSGRTVEQIARETGIPADRIEKRLRAAAAYTQKHC